MSSFDPESWAKEQAEDRKKLASAESALRALKGENKRLLGELEEAESTADVIRGIAGAPVAPPEWLSPAPSSKARRATVCAFLSDTHFDEVVNEDEVMGYNSYNRVIAARRLKSFFEKVIQIPRDYFQGFKYDGCTLFLGGDMFSGSIHEELVETNEGTIDAALLFWLERIHAGIAMLVEHYGKLHIPCVVGNHGRRTKKMRMKLRASDNVDWLLYNLLARDFKDDKRITFEIPVGADIIVSVAGTKYMLTHGDQFRGGGGIAGIFNPIIKGQHKKAQRQIALNQPYDVMILGHWHQFTIGPGFLVNGSLKGYDEYAYLGNFAAEPPQQALWLTVPERKGLSFTTPIYV